MPVFIYVDVLYVYVIYMFAFRYAHSYQRYHDICIYESTIYIHACTYKIKSSINVYRYTHIKINIHMFDPYPSHSFHHYVSTLIDSLPRICKEKIA